LKTDRIERDTLINATLDRVWEVLTHPGIWVGEGDPAKLDIRPGALIVFEMGSTKMPQLVEKFEPKTYISYRWAAAPWRGQEPRADNSTLVEFILTTEAGGTRLRIVESGFGSLETTDDARLSALEDNAKGWSNSVEQLKQSAEQPAS
jgi:uncharacterized protein YndB with AHSA1/START domain